MTGSLRLGNLFGIPIYLHYSWFVIFALITFSLSRLYFPSAYPQWAPWLHWLIGGSTSLLFFASVVAHELTHSLVSRSYGIPVKSITLFIFGGVARITREAVEPLKELLMAGSGPLSSLALGGVFWLLWWLAAPLNQPLGALAQWLLRINILLALFNLIPGFPLDGGRVLRALVWHFSGNFRLATSVAHFLGQGIAFLFMGGGLFLALFTGDLLSGLWIAFIGWFLSSAVYASRRQAAFKERLSGLKAQQVISHDYLVASPSQSLKELVEIWMLPTGRRSFLVEKEGKLVGVLSMKDIRGIPQPLWSTTPVSQVMTPLFRLQLAHPGEEVFALWEKLEEEEISLMPVVEGEQVLGVVTREGLLRLVQTRSELGA